jgi:NitT/TauT family transport system permease protein
VTDQLGVPATGQLTDPASATLAGPVGAGGDADYASRADRAGPADRAGRGTGRTGRRNGPFWIRKVRSRSGRIILGAIVPVLLLVFWQLVVSARLFPSALIPGPLTVLNTAEIWLGTRHTPVMFYSGQMFSDIGATGVRVLVGFALASVTGCALGTAIGVSRLADGLLSPLFKILGPIPPITWIPIAIVIFGVSQDANFALTFVGAVFPVIAATATAVSGVNRDLLRAGRMMGNGRLGLILHVVLPSAFPGIVGGLRIGLGLSWMMAVTSEMLAVHNGLGYTLWNAYNYFDYPAVFAAMIVIGICGLLTDGLLLAASRPATRWHAETGVRS